MYRTCLFFRGEDKILALHDRLRHSTVKLHELERFPECIRSCIIRTRFALGGNPPRTRLAPLLNDGVHADDPHLGHPRAACQEAVSQRWQRSDDCGCDGSKIELGGWAQVLKERVLQSGPCNVGPGLGVIVAGPPPRFAVEDEAEVGQGVQMLQGRQERVALNNNDRTHS